MRERPIPGGNKRGGSLRVLRELSAARLLHQLPMPPGADRDLLSAVGECRAISLLVAFGAGTRALKLRQPPPLAVAAELETLPKGLDGDIALPVELEWRRREIAYRTRNRIGTVADHIDGLATGFGALTKPVQLQGMVVAG